MPPISHARSAAIRQRLSLREGKAVLQDIGEYERIQESLALLKILALGRKDLEAGRVKPVAAVFSGVRDKIKQRRQS